MYLFSTDVFVKQILPPHWRRSYRERVLCALLAPVERVYRELRAYMVFAESELNVSAQVASIEGYLNRKYAGNYNYPLIEVSRESAAGEAVVFVNDRFWHKKEAIESDLRRVLPFGTTLTLERKMD